LKPRRLKFGGFNIESLESRTMLALAGQVVGYIPDYEYASSFSAIDLSAVTHLNYFAVAATVNSQTNVTTLGTNSSSNYSFSQLTSVVNAAHAASPRVSVSITVDPGSQFQTIAVNSTATSTFISAILAFCSTYHLDGIDLDYEPGVTLGASDQTTWGNFLATLHAQTSANNLTLSAAVEPAHINIPFADISDLDWYYLMDYNLEFNSSAPYSDTLTYLNSWTNFGVPKSKLVVGVPFYGLAGTGWGNSMPLSYSSILSGYASAHGGALPAPNVDSITLQTIVNKMVVNTTWGFNSIADMQQKAQYILQNGYAGMMIWELGQDHYNGAGYDSMSLLPAIKTAFSIPVTASAGAVYSLTTTALNVASGTVTVSGDVTTIDPNLMVTVGSGTTLTLSGSARLPGLTLNGGTATVAPGSGAVVFGSLVITNGGLLDLTNNVLVAKNTTPATVFNLLKLGLNAGGGHWNGSTGILSTTAHGDTNFLTTLGYRKGDGTPFDGVNTTTNDTLVKYTYLGDADLNGIVNGADYQLIDSGLGAHASGWSSGDFNYDGVINGTDYSLIDNTFNQITATSASALAIVAAVPPPAHQRMALNIVAQPDTSSWLDDFAMKRKAKSAFLVSDKTPIVFRCRAVFSI
jgi:hypothetical protein